MRQVRIEYGVQTRSIDGWEIVGTYPTYEVANFECDRRIEDFGGAHRVVCREVGEWCECKEVL